MADSLIPGIQNKDLNFIGTYVKNSDYKNFLRIQNNSLDISNAFETIKNQVENDFMSGGLSPEKMDKIKFANEYALKRDFLTRYASRLSLKKSALDKKLFFDSLIVARLSK